MEIVHTLCDVVSTATRKLRMIFEQHTTLAVPPQVPLTQTLEVRVIQCFIVYMVKEKGIMVFQSYLCYGSNELWRP